jgi:hypothetical protein
MSIPEQSPHNREPHSQPPQFLSPEVLLDFSFKIDRDFRAVHGRLQEHDAAISVHGQKLGELHEAVADHDQAIDSIMSTGSLHAIEAVEQRVDSGEDGRKFAPHFTRRHVAAVTAIAAVAAYATMPKLLESRVGSTRSAVTEAQKPVQKAEPAKPLQPAPDAGARKLSSRHSNVHTEKHHAKKTHHAEKNIPAARAAQAVTSKSVQISVPVKQTASVPPQPKASTPEVKPAKPQQPAQVKPKTAPRAPNGGASYGSQVAESTAAQVGGSAPYETSATPTKAGGAVAP